MRSIDGHGGVPDGIRGIAISPDGKYLLTAGSDGRAFLRHLPSAKVVRKFDGKPGTFYGVAFSRDSQYFALSYLRPDKAKHGDGLHVGDCATGKTKYTEMPSSMWAIAFAKNGSLVVAGEGRHILFLNEKYQPGRKLGQGDVVRVAFANDDKTLVAISQTGEAKAWDIASGKSTALDAGGPLWALAHDTKTDTIALAGTEGIVHRFDASAKKIGGGEPLAMHTGQARGFAVLRDGRFFSCGWDGRLLLWDGGTAHVVHTLDDRMTEIMLAPLGERYLLVLHNERRSRLRTSRRSRCSERTHRKSRTHRRRIPNRSACPATSSRSGIGAGSFERFHFPCSSLAVKSRSANKKSLLLSDFPTARLRVGRKTGAS